MNQLQPSLDEMFYMVLYQYFVRHLRQPTKIVEAAKPILTYDPVENSHKIFLLETTEPIVLHQNLYNKFRTSE